MYQIVIPTIICATQTTICATCYVCYVTTIFDVCRHYYNKYFILLNETYLCFSCDREERCGLEALCWVCCTLRIPKICCSLQSNFRDLLLADMIAF